MPTPSSLSEVNHLIDAKHYQEASAALESLLLEHPAASGAFDLMRQLVERTGRYSQAVDWLSLFLEQNPQSSGAFRLLGFVMCKLGQFQAGIECFEKSLAIHPMDAHCICDRASALAELGRNAEALLGYEQALALAPDFAEAHGYRGNALLALGRQDAAIASFDQAIALDPRLASAFVNRGNAFMQQDRYSAALADYDQAITLQARNAMAHANRAVALKHLHRHQESQESSVTAISLSPGYFEAQFTLALSQLLSGDFEHGFQSYQVRWKTAAFAPVRRQFTQPQWLGEASIAGKRLLVHNEQGLGDSIQFCRFVAGAAQSGAEVIYEVQAPLLDLMQSLSGVHTLVRQGDSLPDFDYYCPVMSLPLALGTRLASLPAPIAYLHASPAKRSQWQQRLGTASGPRIGLAWSGNPKHQGDRHRSIALASLLQALPAGPQYVSLQKEVRDSDTAALLQRPDLLHFSDAMADFSDTAALCSAMDLVIAVDTSVAHLAGALGIGTWLLLPHLPDWRWLLERTDTPWYPQMRLWRQKSAGDWDAVLQDLHAALRAHPW